MLLAAYYHLILAFFFAVLAALLIIVVLLQRGRGVGLAGAFGGSGAHTAFGAKTGDLLTWLTVVMAALFLLFAIALNYVFVEGKPDLGTPPPGEGPGDRGSLLDFDRSAGRSFCAAPTIFGKVAADETSAEHEERG